MTDTNREAPEGQTEAPAPLPTNVRFCRIAELGMEPLEMQVPEGATWREALQRGNVHEGLELRVNGHPVSLDDVVEDGDVAVALPKIRGGVGNL